MIIDKVHIINFRNFSDALVNLSLSTLIIGANDIGKTNLIYSLRLLLDKSLSEKDIQPSETDFHIQQDGSQTENFSITRRA
jgi:putative ATP-dependent endonuclease of OLD family